jgi:hypothetical protein
MSQTNAQKKKQQKSKARERTIRKRHNIQRNAPEKRFRLDVLMGDEWKIGVRQWAYGRQVESHRAETEKRRKAGEEIVPGRVVDMRLGKIVLEIPGSKVKGTAPDKIADGAKAEDFKVEEHTIESPDDPIKPTVEPEPKKKGGISKFLRVLTGKR